MSQVRANLSSVKEGAAILCVSGSDMPWAVQRQLCVASHETNGILYFMCSLDILSESWEQASAENVCSNKFCLRCSHCFVSLG